MVLVVIPYNIKLETYMQDLKKKQFFSLDEISIFLLQRYLRLLHHQAAVRCEFRRPHLITPNISFGQGFLLWHPSGPTGEKQAKKQINLLKIKIFGSCRHSANSQKTKDKNQPPLRRYSIQKPLHALNSTIFQKRQRWKKHQ